MKQRSTYFLLPALIFIFWFATILSASILKAQGEGTLDWKLVGTAVAEDPSENFAIMEYQPTGNQRAYRQGDRAGDLLIKKTRSGSVILGTRMGDQVLAMASGGSAGNVEPSPQVGRLDRKDVDATLPDYMQLMREVRIRPHFEAGQPAGFYITRIEPESIFAKMGLENGDVIIGVNGRPIARTLQAIEFYDALKKGATVFLKIKRDEKIQELKFIIQ